MSHTIIAKRKKPPMIRHLLAAAVIAATFAGAAQVQAQSSGPREFQVCLDNKSKHRSEATVTQHGTQRGFGRGSDSTSTLQAGGGGRPCTPVVEGHLVSVSAKVKDLTCQVERKPAQDMTVRISEGSGLLQLNCSIECRDCPTLPPLLGQ